MCQKQTHSSISLNFAMKSNSFGVNVPSFLSNTGCYRYSQQHLACTGSRKCNIPCNIPLKESEYCIKKRRQMHHQFVPWLQKMLDLKGNPMQTICGVMLSGQTSLSAVVTCKKQTLYNITQKIEHLQIRVVGVRMLEIKCVSCNAHLLRQALAQEQSRKAKKCFSIWGGGQQPTTIYVTHFTTA